MSIYSNYAHEYLTREEFKYAAEKERYEPLRWGGDYEDESDEDDDEM